MGKIFGNLSAADFRGIGLITISLPAAEADWIEQSNDAALILEWRFQLFQAGSLDPYPAWNWHLIKSIGSTTNATGQKRSDVLAASLASDLVVRRVGPAGRERCLGGPAEHLTDRCQARSDSRRLDDLREISPDPDLDQNGSRADLVDPVEFDCGRFACYWQAPSG